MEILKIILRDANQPYTILLKLSVRTKYILIRSDVIILLIYFSLGFVFPQHILSILKLVLNIVVLPFGSIGLFLSFEFSSFLILSEFGDLFLTTSAQLSLQRERDELRCGQIISLCFTSGKLIKQMILNLQKFGTVRLRQTKHAHVFTGFKNHRVCTKLEKKKKKTNNK